MLSKIPNPDQEIAKLVIKEIANDVRSGIAAEFFYYHEDSFPYPLSAAEVITKDDGSRFIVWLTCNPAHLGRGYGSVLLRGILSTYPGELILTLPTRNAVRFYKKHGFQPLDDGVFARKAS